MRRLAFATATGRPRPAGSLADGLRRLRLRFGRPPRALETVTGHVQTTAWVWDGWSVAWIVEVVTLDGVVPIVVPAHMGKHIAIAQPGDRIVVRLAARGRTSIARGVTIVCADRVGR